MKKILKLFVIITIMLAFIANLSVFAAPADDQNQNQNSTSTSATTNNETTATQTNTDKKSTTQVTSVASVDEGKLNVSDILNILLIATGIVIILLAIAIFVKMK
ncbi:MAG: hypothetical protein IKN65_08730 [Clostridia bacterium]|nr:hypothetical protein [Clostridia bacterium]